MSTPLGSGLPQRSSSTDEDVVFLVSLATVQGSVRAEGVVGTRRIVRARGARPPPFLRRGARGRPYAGSWTVPQGVLGRGGFLGRGGVLGRGAAPGRGGFLGRGGSPGRGGAPGRGCRLPGVGAGGNGGIITGGGVASGSGAATVSGAYVGPRAGLVKRSHSPSSSEDEVVFLGEAGTGGGKFSLSGFAKSTTTSFF